jgi:primosomal protein N' (replication factor Y)
MPERIRKTDMPVISVVDLRGEFRKKNFSIFSDLLRNKMKDRLEKKEQIILFVNQRGMANAVVCRECGFTEKCPNCEIALKYHKSGIRSQDSGVSGNLRLPVYPEGAIGQSRLQGCQTGDRLICHYCGYTKPPELLCPTCRSPHIRHIGVGTQRVEEDVKKLFPQARVIRADKDTTGEKSGFEPIYRAFSNKEYDILIGTQMVAKGLDFEGVTLIGIILADIGLHVPDFRSSERLFQILTQVSGRCGRGAGVGEVVLQTYSPDHPVIQRAAAYEYSQFMQTELELRKSLSYPPFNRMIKFTVVGKAWDEPASPDDPMNQALNRRVEISVYPPESQ